MKAFRIEDVMEPDLEQVLESEDDKVWSEGRRGLHWPQSNYGSISSRLTPTTTLGLAVIIFASSGIVHSGNGAGGRKSRQGKYPQADLKFG